MFWTNNVSYYACSRNTVLEFTFVLCRRNASMSNIIWQDWNVEPSFTKQTNLHNIFTNCFYSIPFYIPTNNLWFDLLLNGIQLNLLYWKEFEPWVSISTALQVFSRTSHKRFRLFQLYFILLPFPLLSLPHSMCTFLIKLDWWITSNQHHSCAVITRGMQTVTRITLWHWRIGLITRQL